MNNEYPIDEDLVLTISKVIVYTMFMIFFLSILYRFIVAPAAEMTFRMRARCKGDLCLIDSVAHGYIKDLFDGEGVETPKHNESTTITCEGFDQKLLGKFKSLKKYNQLKERYDEYEASASNPNLTATCKDNICMKTFVGGSVSGSGSGSGSVSVSGSVSGSGNGSIEAIIMLRNFYQDTLRVLPADDPRTKRLAKFKINDSKIFEVDPRNGESLTSFTINKGERMGVCLRQGDGSIVDDEDIKFVFLHELAHIVTLSQGHKPDFWANFKWMLTIVYANKLMIPKNYSITPANYCKIKITHNPYFDD